MSKQEDSNLHFYQRRRLMQSTFGGVVLVTAGVIFLLQNFLHFDVMGKLWPVLVILLGIVVILNQRKS